MEDFILIPVPLAQFREAIRNEVKQALAEDRAATATPEDDYLTTAQVRALLKISNVTLYMWRKAGLIPFTRVNRRLLFNKIDLAEALKALGKNKLLNRLTA